MTYILGPKWLPRHSRIARGIVFAACVIAVGILAALIAGIAR